MNVLPSSITSEDEAYGLLAETIVLAFDPGYANCGYVIALMEKNDDLWMPSLIDHGHLSTPAEWNIFERCRYIVSSLRRYAQEFGVGLIVSEKFFGAPFRSNNKTAPPKENYNRGVFDAIAYDMLAPWPRVELHPAHVKKAATGKGHAKKPEIVGAIRAKFKPYYPSTLAEISVCPKEEQSHILEAWVMASVGSVLWAEILLKAELRNTDSIAGELLKKITADDRLDDYYTAPHPARPELVI